MSSTRFAPGAALRGTLRPPPDKSISHRAALIAAMGDGETRIEGFLDAADTRSTLAAVERLGGEVEESEAAGRGGKETNAVHKSPQPDAIDVRIRGIGLRGPGERWPGDEVPIDVGNAGTLLRILPGWLAGQGVGAWTLDGDESIRRRPVDRIVEPLGRMGADVSCREGTLPPVRVHGSELRGIEYRMPVASAQVKSCLLLAGLLAEGETRVTEPAPTRDHTERMLAAAGVEIETEPVGTIPVVRGGAARRITVGPAERLVPGPISIPGDFSSGAFFAAGAAIVRGSGVRIEGVGLNPTRIGLLGVLHRMGAAVEVEEDAGSGPEPRGALDARSGPLKATRVHGEEVPLTIDELPLVALLGCFAEGRTVVSGAEELRHKESDRIASVVDGLRGIGADIEARDDGFAVRGSGGLRGGTLDAHGDHRLAMLGAIAGLASREGVEVVGMEAAAVSYPRFEEDLESLTAKR